MYALLPCNGLDKPAGCLTREIALLLQEKSGSEIICPVFYRLAEARYSQLVSDRPLLVIDGCLTRCATKLAAEKGLPIARRLNISELAKEAGLDLGASLRLTPAALQLAEQAADGFLRQPLGAEAAAAAGFFPAQLEYEVYRKEKFIFRLPLNPGFYFSENDVWAYVSGTKARVGVTDFVQKSLSDIMFFSPPELGAEIGQFEELGAIESGKAVFEVAAPLSGRVTAINTGLIENPGLINQSPYEQGWVAELELANFAEDRELLHGFAGYFPIMKRKVDEFHV